MTTPTQEPVREGILTKLREDGSYKWKFVKYDSNGIPIWKENKDRMKIRI